MAFNYGGGAVCGNVYFEKAYFYFLENKFLNNSLEGFFKISSGSAFTFFGSPSSSPILFCEKNLYISNKAEVFGTIVLLYASIYENGSSFLCKF